MDYCIVLSRVPGMRHSYDWELHESMLADQCGGGGAYTFVACLSHSTIIMIGHASSLSRWRTIPTPNRDTSLQHSSAQYVCSICYIKKNADTISFGVS